MDLDEWKNDAGDNVSLEAMTAMVKEYREKREAWEEQKKQASEAWSKVEEIQNKMLAALDKSGKKSYKVDGVGTFSIVKKQVVSLPKEADKKREFYQYIKETYGEDVFESMASIHYQTLNSFYNQEAEKAEDRAMFHLPGLDAPTVKLEPRFTRAK